MYARDRFVFPATALMVCIAIAFTANSAFAQQYEIHPYIGGIFPVSFIGDASLKSTGYLGVRAGVYLRPSVEFEANLNYMNHFEFEGTDRGNRAVVWDANISYMPPFKTGDRIQPFVSGGVGGVTAVVSALHDNTQLLLDATAE